MSVEIRRIRLMCDAFWVDVRVSQLAPGRWLASADTPDGPSVGLGWHPLEAVVAALQPFDGAADQLLSTVPDELLYWR